MGLFQRRYLVWGILTCSIALATRCPWAGAQALISAKIGIQLTSENTTAPAKTQTRAHKGDLLRIYVIPNNAGHVYVVHSDGQTATLLTQDLQLGQVQKDALITLPDNKNFYQIDGTSPTERFTIVCSTTPVPEMQALLPSGKLTHQSWLQIEATLRERGKIDLSTEVDKPIAMAGNTRAAESTTFVEGLPMYSGKSILVKHYDFTVAK